MSLRKRVRDAVVTAVTGLTTTGSRVYQSRVYPMQAATLPGIVVYTESETVQYLTMGLPRTQMRVATFAVEIYVRGVDGYDEQIDQIAAEVEGALYANVELGGLVKDTQVTGITFAYAGDGDKPVGVGSMSVDVTYTTTEGNIT